MKIVYHPKCLEYSSLGHPENPQRVKQAYTYLKNKFEFVKPKMAKEEDLLLVHDKAHLRNLQNLSFFDPDCPHYEDIYQYSRLAAGGAILAMKVGGFSLMRPPGHHAGRNRTAGFCYLNNIAIAVKKSAKKILIIDIDGHHGDGTQEIFLKDKQVIYLSLHRSPGYPGSGLKTVDNCHNYPLFANCGDEVYLKTLEKALTNVELKGVEQVAVSAGFDGFYLDPLASLGLTSEAYYRIGQMIAELKLSVFALLEGGYVADKLGENINQFLLGLSG